MQKWFEKTASFEQIQTETLSTMLEDLQMDLPQISPEHKEILEEEIPPDNHPRGKFANVGKYSFERW
jgi:hypothetical protein